LNKAKYVFIIVIIIIVVVVVLVLKAYRLENGQKV